jgi:uncharacterized protein (DUF58 family)
MDRDELLRKINTFPLVAEELACDILAGDFRSVFNGKGIEFNEVRRYEQGDDIRAIDRNVSARHGTPYIKLYREERELTVFIVLDCSASMFVGNESAVRLTRIDQAIQISALIAFSAERSGQRFGALFFDKENRNIFKPKHGRAHVLAFTQAALESKPKSSGTGLAGALSAAARILKRRSIVIVISDFLSLGWDHELGRLSEKHDCIVCRITDPLETDFPNMGVVSIEDPETGFSIAANTTSESFRSSWNEWNEDRAAFCTAVFKRYNTACMELSTVDDAVRVVKKFFRARRRR